MFKGGRPIFASEFRRTEGKVANLAGFRGTGGAVAILAGFLGIGADPSRLLGVGLLSAAYPLSFNGKDIALADFWIISVSIMVDTGAECCLRCLMGGRFFGAFSSLIAV